MNLYSK